MEKLIIHFSLSFLMAGVVFTAVSVVTSPLVFPFCYDAVLKAKNIARRRPWA